MCRLLLLSLIFFALLHATGQPLTYAAKLNSKKPKGYFFLATYKIHPALNPGKRFLIIMDGSGHIVYYRHQPEGGSDFRMYPGPKIAYSSEGVLYFESESFKKTDSVVCANSLITDTHDGMLLPDGHFLMLGYEKVAMDLSSYPLFGANHLRGSKNAVVSAGVIQELNQDKKVIFEWHAKDHFKFEEIDPFFLWDTLHVDWTHFNSVERDRDGNYLISSKHFHEITKINRRDGTVMWRMGGKRNQFNFIKDSILFYSPHNVRRTPDGGISLFDNGFADTLHKHPARALVYRVDEIKKTATRVWSYAGLTPTFSVAAGNVQQMKNKFRLVNFGKTPASNKGIELLNPKGKTVFELKFEDSLSIYRAYYYSHLLFKLDRPVIRKYKRGKKLYLEAGNGYASYCWNTGATTRTIAVNYPGKYYVYVPAANTGYTSSPIYEVKGKEISENQ